MVLFEASRGVYSLISNNFITKFIKNLTPSIVPSSTAGPGQVLINNPNNIMTQVLSRRLSTAAPLPKEIEDLIDPVQKQLLDEECILLDNDDRVIGKSSKKDCHIVRPNGDIRLHRAFSVFLFNSKGELLIQQRSKAKITFPSMWTNTCCSHPLAVQSELVETDALGVRIAAQRRLEVELGIPAEDVPIDSFHYLTRIHYKAASNSIWGEHEIDYILFLQKDVRINPNPNEIEEVRYVSLDELKSMWNGENILFTPWFKLILEKRLPLWWSNLNNLKQFEDHDTINRML